MIEPIVKTVTYGEYSVSVREATGLDGMRRQLMRSEAFIEDPKNIKKSVPVENEQARQIMRLITYPDYVSCMVKSEGLPETLTFEEFILLPDRLLDEWGKAVYSLNSHWLGLEIEEEDKKKASKSEEKLPNS